MEVNFRKICSCKCELSQLEPEIKQQNRELAEVNQNLLSIQKQRQDNIWKLLNFTVSINFNFWVKKGNLVIAILHAFTNAA